MNSTQRPYKAIVWPGSKDASGIRVELMANNLEEAEKTLRAEYGQEIIFTLVNEDDASTSR